MRSVGGRVLCDDAGSLGDEHLLAAGHGAAGTQQALRALPSGAVGCCTAISAVSSSAVCRASTSSSEIASAESAANGCAMFVPGGARVDTRLLRHLLQHMSHLVLVPQELVFLPQHLG